MLKKNSLRKNKKIISDNSNKNNFSKNTLLLGMLLGSILTATAGAIINAPNFFKSLREIPAQYEMTKSEFISWYRNDSAWNGVWETSNITTGTAKDKDNHPYIKIAIWSENGNIIGGFSSDKICEEFSVKLRKNETGNLDNPLSKHKFFKENFHIAGPIKSANEAEFNIHEAWGSDTLVMGVLKVKMNSPWEIELDPGDMESDLTSNRKRTLTKRWQHEGSVNGSIESLKSLSALKGFCNVWEMREMIRNIR